MKDELLRIICYTFMGFFLGCTLTIIWLYSGNWLLGVLGMDLAMAETLLYIFKYAFFSMAMAFLLLHYLWGRFSRWWKKRKQEKDAHNDRRDQV